MRSKRSTKIKSSGPFEGFSSSRRNEARGITAPSRVRKRNGTQKLMCVCYTKEKSNKNNYLSALYYYWLFCATMLCTTRTIPCYYCETPKNLQFITVFLSCYQGSEASRLGFKADSVDVTEGSMLLCRHIGVSETRGP